MSIKSDIIVSISFALTLVTVGIASFYVPNLESKSGENLEVIGQLQNSYFLETQRFGQNSLNFSAAAQILSSERILYISSEGRNDFTREVILQQGKDALVNGMRERKKAIENTISALKTAGKTFSVIIPPIPEESANNLFTIFENTQDISIEELRANVKDISTISAEYKKAWTTVTETTINALTDLKNTNSRLVSEISFWMKIALILQVFAMVLVFAKDRLSN